MERIYTDDEPAALGELSGDSTGSRLESPNNVSSILVVPSDDAAEKEQNTKNKKKPKIPTPPLPRCCWYEGCTSCHKEDWIPPEPLYRQYILDRVHGLSHVDRDQRSKLRKEQEEKRKQQSFCCWQQHLQQQQDAKKKKDDDDDIHDEQPINNNSNKSSMIENDQNGDSDDVNENDDDADPINNNDYVHDPTSCFNRPPHWCCFVPPFVARFPFLLEQNPFCIWAGNIRIRKCHYHHIRRRRLFAIGIFFNLASLVLVTLSSWAFSMDHYLLTRTSFTRGQFKIIVVNPNLTQALNEAHIERTGDRTSPSLVSESGELALEQFQMDMGFRGFAVRDDTGYFGGNQVYGFSDVCEDLKGNPNFRGFEEAVCGKCKTSSNRFFLSCLLNIIMICKNLLSNVTRMYPRYDLNCLNTMGSLMGTLSVAIGINTIYLYQRRCYREVEDMPFVVVPYYLGLNLLEFPISHDDLVVRRTWDRGPGMMALILATFFRFGDAMVNYFVPTPSITRSRTEQEDYESKYGEQELDLLEGAESALLVVGSSRTRDSEAGILNTGEKQDSPSDLHEAASIEIQENPTAQETLQSLSFSSGDVMHYA